LDLIRQYLTDLSIPAIRSFETIGSTNDEALAWAEQGAADGSLVIADQQTKGRGRLGRSWVTNPGAALAFSVILRPTAEEIDHLGLFSPLAGLAVCLALQALHLPAEIKWPNDVLLARRKTCGILAESAWQGDVLQGVVIGIGINVASSSVPPAAEVLFPATYVEEHLEEPVDRLELLHSVLKSFFEWRQHVGSAGFIQAWESRLAFKGEMVNLKNSGGQGFSGVLSGVDGHGNLRILLEDGTQKLVSVGDVHLRPVNG
ncbi:biotin--[acetyl-CoA-carboxylase] ligase, partial [bacterium]|nr:biotin--[acetyl-CoA-carboxylase] ligase [bacterium]